MSPKPIEKSAAAFGAALAGVAAADMAEAQVVPLTFGNPGTAVATFTLTAPVNAVQVQINYSGSTGFANNLRFYGGSTLQSIQLTQYFVPANAQFAKPSQTYTAAQTFVSNAFPLATNLPFSDTTQYLVFRNFAGRMGWLSLAFSAPDTIQFKGEINTESGGPIHVGAMDDDMGVVPLPATLPLAGLGVLALGAAGLRRKRAKAKEIG